MLLKKKFYGVFIFDFISVISLTIYALLGMGEGAVMGQTCVHTLCAFKSNQFVVITFNSQGPYKFI